MLVQTSCNYSRLQNGSDVRGTSIETGSSPVTFSPADAYCISKSFASFVATKAGKPLQELSIAMGRDSRVSGPDICKGVVAGLTSEGVQVTDVGLSTTPAMFMTCLGDYLDADGSLMVTASHLPFERNGMKMFTALGGVSKLELEGILLHAAAIRKSMATLTPAANYDLVGGESFVEAYAGHLRSVVQDAVGGDLSRPLEGMKVVVDAGNGSAGFFATRVLAPLGADTGGSQFLDPDGTFPNHVANPEDANAMDSLVGAVLREGADMGVLFDTDGDRCGIVDSQGRVYNRNVLIAAMSGICLEDSPGSTIVTDSVTSDGLTRFIEKRGGIHCRYVRGYRNVIDKAFDLERKGVCVPLAIETSGHGAMKENFFLDDGAYMATKLIAECARRGGKLEGLVEGLEEPAESVEFRVLARSDPRKYLADFRDFAASVPGWELARSHEGVRVVIGESEGWMLVRASLHDPVLVVNIEGNVPNVVAPTKERFEAWSSTKNGLGSNE